MTLQESRQTSRQASSRPRGRPPRLRGDVFKYEARLVASLQRLEDLFISIKQGCNQASRQRSRASKICFKHDEGLEASLAGEARLEAGFKPLDARLEA